MLGISFVVAHRCARPAPSPPTPCSPVVLCFQPVIALTGNDDVKDFVDAGADAMLTKPVNWKKLAAAMASALEACRLREEVRYIRTLCRLYSSLLAGLLRVEARFTRRTRLDSRRRLSLPSPLARPVRAHALHVSKNRPSSEKPCTE